MRVGIDVRATQFGGGLRGTGRYIYNLLQGLLSLEDNVEYVLLCLEGLPVPEPLKNLGDRVRISQITGPHSLESDFPWYQKHLRLRQLPVLPGIHWRSFLNQQANEFRATVKRERLDVVHFTACFDLHLPPVLNCPSKTVYTFLDAIPLVFANDFYDNWPIPVRRLYNRQKEALQQADQVVAISDYSKEDLIRLYGIVPERAHRVYCALQPGLNAPIAENFIEETRKKFRLKNRYFAFCSVADRHKGVDSLIGALADLRESSGYPYQLAMIGPQHKATRDYVRELCFDSGLSGRDVVVTGFVSDEELRALFKGAIALVSPSRYEGFGYPAAQALAIGVPVIASNRASLPEVVGDAGILVDPDEIEVLVSAMQRLASDEELRSCLIAKGSQRAELFDYVELARQMADTYSLAARS